MNLPAPLITFMEKNDIDIPIISALKSTITLTLVFTYTLVLVQKKKKRQTETKNNVIEAHIISALLHVLSHSAVSERSGTGAEVRRLCVCVLRERERTPKETGGKEVHVESESQRERERKRERERERERRDRKEREFPLSSPFSSTDGPPWPCTGSQHHYFLLYLRHSTIKMSNREQVHRLWGECLAPIQ